MKHGALTFAALLLATLPATADAAGIYQWRDAEGHVHFGDRPPPGVEPENVVVKPNVYETPSLEPLAAALAVDEVVLYSAEWCGYCRKARRYFRAHDIPFREYDVEKSDKGRRDYKRLGARGVPVILIGRQRLNGFSAAAFESAWAAR